MKYGEIIKICSGALKDVYMKYNKDDIAPNFISNTLGYILYMYKNNVINDNSITGLNNPINILDPKDGNPKNFSTLDECFIQFKESYYDDIDFNNEEYAKICKSFNLYRFDKEVLGENKGNIIDVKEEDSKPIVDVYKVEKRNTVIGTTSNLEEAKKMEKKNPGSVIKNSRNVIVGQKVQLKSSKVASTRYEVGTKVVCNGINVYKKFRDTSPSRTLNGEYYMYDGKIVDGKIALCGKPEFVGDAKMIVGFVRVSDLNK